MQHAALSQLLYQLIYKEAFALLKTESRIIFPTDCQNVIGNGYVVEQQKTISTTS